MVKVKVFKPTTSAVNKVDVPTIKKDLLVPLEIQATGSKYVVKGYYGERFTVAGSATLVTVPDNKVFYAVSACLNMVVAVAPVGVEYQNVYLHSIYGGVYDYILSLTSTGVQHTHQNIAVSFSEPLVFKPGSVIKITTDSAKIYGKAIITGYLVDRPYS